MSHFSKVPSGVLALRDMHASHAYAVCYQASDWKTGAVLRPMTALAQEAGWSNDAMARAMRKLVAAGFAKSEGSTSARKWWLIPPPSSMKDSREPGVKVRADLSSPSAEAAAPSTLKRGSAPANGDRTLPRTRGKERTAPIAKTPRSNAAKPQSVKPPSDSGSDLRSDLREEEELERLAVTSTADAVGSSLVVAPTAQIGLPAKTRGLKRQTYSAPIDDASVARMAIIAKAALDGTLDGRSPNKAEFEDVMRMLAWFLAETWKRPDAIYTVADCAFVRGSIPDLRLSTIVHAIQGSRRDAYWRKRGGPNLRQVIGNASSLASLATGMPKGEMAHNLERYRRARSKIAIQHLDGFPEPTPEWAASISPVKLELFADEAERAVRVFAARAARAETGAVDSEVVQ